METVYGCDYITVFALPVVVGQQVVRLACDRYDLRRVVQIDRFLIFEAVNDEIACQFGIGLALFRLPVQHITLGCPFGFQLLDLFRSPVVQMGIGRDQCRIAVVVPFQAVGHTFVVPEYFVCRPETISADMGKCAFVAHLAGQFSGFHGAGHVLADIQVSAIGVFVPPFDQCDIVGCRMSDFPIYLWNVIVYPTLFYPACHVCIQVVVVLQSVGVAA